MMTTTYEVGPGAYGMAIDPAGRAWTTLVERGELVRVGPDRVLDRFPLEDRNARPMVLATDPDGAVRFSCGNGELGRVDSTGTISTRPVAGPEDGLYGLCTGPDDALWFTLLSAGRVGRLAPDGTVDEFPVAAGGMPSLITTGPDGAVWFTLNQADALGRIDTAGRITTYPLPTTGAAPVGIHGGPDAVWFAEIGAGRLGRIEPGGRIEEFPLPDLSCRPHAVAATADGGCWATLWATGSLVRLDRDGRITAEEAFAHGAEPHGLAVAADGSVRVALQSGQVAHVVVD